MNKKIKHIEVYWWVKDSTRRARIKGMDIITEKHLSNELEYIAQADCLEDFDKDDADFCLPDIADSGYDICSLGEDSQTAFINFSGAINVIAIEPIEFGIDKVKKIRY